MYGGTKQGLSLDDVKNYLLLLPPHHEQSALVMRIENETARLDTALSRATRQIALMREYRTRLIADVVTGKVDVRAVAATLPDLPPESPFAPPSESTPSDDPQEEAADDVEA